MILNKSLTELGDHEKALLGKGLRPASTRNWISLVENEKWINVHQHVKQTEWRAVHEERKDVDYELPQKLIIPQNSRITLKGPQSHHSGLNFVQL